MNVMLAGVLAALTTAAGRTWGSLSEVGLLMVWGSVLLMVARRVGAPRLAVVSERLVDAKAD